MNTLTTSSATDANNRTQYSTRICVLIQLQAQKVEIRSQKYVLKSKQYLHIGLLCLFSLIHIWVEVCMYSLDIFFVLQRL